MFHCEADERTNALRQVSNGDLLIGQAILRLETCRSREGESPYPGGALFSPWTFRRSIFTMVPAKKASIPLA
jgi:hypothetical protein